MLDFSTDLPGKQVPPAGIEPATPGLGKLTGGLYKGLKIPPKALSVKGLRGIFSYA